MSGAFVLLHAPVVGPATWLPVARELTRLGATAVVPDMTGFADDGPPYAPRFIDLGGAHGSAGVLVPHSGAGVFAPYLADAVDAAAVIFVDAALPSRSGQAAVMDQAFLPFIRNVAVHGVVPPWPDWWPAEAMAQLVPDEQVRGQVMGEARPLPLAFFEEQLPPVPASWRSRPCGYLRFSDGYADLASEAASRGWPVRELPGEHLHMLVEPAEVARALLDICQEV